jgi:hypothetical protein
MARNNKPPASFILAVIYPPSLSLSLSLSLDTLREKKQEELTRSTENQGSCEDDDGTKAGRGHLDTNCSQNYRVHKELPHLLFSAAFRGREVACGKKEGSKEGRFATEIRRQKGSWGCNKQQSKLLALFPCKPQTNKSRLTVLFDNCHVTWSGRHGLFFFFPFLSFFLIL